MKKILFLLIIQLITLNLNSQVLTKIKKFKTTIYKLNSPLNMDSLETILLSSYRGTPDDFLYKLQVDTMFVSKKTKLNDGIYIFLSDYNDDKSVRAPYSNSFIDYRFSNIYKKMIFIVKITSLSNQEFTIQYGKDKLYFKTE